MMEEKKIQTPELKQYILANFDAIVNEKYFKLQLVPGVTNYTDIYSALDFFKKEFEVLEQKQKEEEAKLSAEKEEEAKLAVEK